MADIHTLAWLDVSVAGVVSQGICFSYPIALQIFLSAGTNDTCQALIRGDFESLFPLGESCTGTFCFHKYFVATE